MSFEDIKAEINLLLIEMENQPQDLHELQEKVHEKLRELRAFGMPLPDDLVELEETLEIYFNREVRDKNLDTKSKGH
ncbi:MAG: hypothetical protein ACR2OW_11785 [Methyloligellaceae bacterium]